MGEEICFVHHHILTDNQRKDCQGLLGGELFKREISEKYIISPISEKYIISPYIGFSGEILKSLPLLPFYATQKYEVLRSNKLTEYLRS